ncbi:MAG: hypothetical protein ACI9CQ_001797, partial [Saprospiraceae bacterium]
AVLKTSTTIWLNLSTISIFVFTIGEEHSSAQGNKKQNFIDRTLKYKSRLFLTSGGKMRTPNDSQFAKQFLSAVRSFGGADGIVSFSELVASLETARPQPKSG